MQRLDVQEKTHRTSLKELEQICQAHEITIAKMHIEKEHFRETIASLECQNLGLVNDLEQEKNRHDTITTTTTQQERKYTNHQGFEQLAVDIFEHTDDLSSRLKKLMEMSQENKTYIRRVRGVVKRLFGRIEFESSRVETLRSQEMRLGNKIRDLKIERESLKDVLQKARAQHAKDLESRRKLLSSQSVLRAQVTLLESKKIELTERLASS